MKKYMLFALGLVVLAAVSVYFLTRYTEGEQFEDIAETPKAKKISDIGENSGGNGAGSEKSRASSRSRRERRVRSRIETEQRTDLAPADKKSLLTIEAAVDEDDLAKMLMVYKTASVSTNVEVRAELVSALDWFGKDVLEEITPMMADPDDDVAEAARNAWENALVEVSSAKDRLRLARLALDAISAEDSLMLIGSQFANAASDLIDGINSKTEADARRREVVESVVDLIESDKAANSAAGREIYEEITGNEWVSREEAAKYLDDPDNYEPPDEDEGAVASATQSEEYEFRTRSSRSSRSSRRRSSGSSFSGSTAVDGDFTDGGAQDPETTASGQTVGEIPQDDGVDEGEGEDPDQSVAIITGDDESAEEGEMGLDIDPEEPEGSEEGETEGNNGVAGGEVPQ